MACSDSHEVSQLCELKIDLDAISVIAHYSANSDIIMDEQMPIFGGYAGGIEHRSFKITGISFRTALLDYKETM